MIIDANMYWMPEDLFLDETLRNTFLDLALEDGGRYAYSEQVNETEIVQVVIEKPRGYQNLNYVQGQYKLEQQIRDMDEAGVGEAILKLPGCQEWLDLELCKYFNDGMAEHVRRSQGRMHALAVLPPIVDSQVLKELYRCVHELGMVGLQLSSHYGDRYLDDPLFRPLLKEMNRLKLPIYVHHTPLPVQYDSLLAYDNLRRSYGRCADQVTAVTRELFCGMFEELADLKLVHSMLGGGFFSYMDLMLPKKPARKEVVGRFIVETEDARRYLNKNIYFEMSHASPWGKTQLESAIKIAGSDHILFGTSYPVRSDWLLDGPSFVQALQISKVQKEEVLCLTARRVYGI
ncbi:MAG: amidohydrolase [Spirochaetia bacterium]|nr:amidohydrolase [Spirochaetia bacterium]